MASPGGGGGGIGGPELAPTTGGSVIRKRLAREELADIEYLFDKLAGGQDGAGAPATTANSPLPLPIIPMAAGAASLPPPSSDHHASSSPTIGVAGLKFALRAFGLPVRKDDIVALLRRHGHLGPCDAQPPPQQPPRQPAMPRLSRGAFRELVGQALRERVPGGRDADMARAFALLDRGGKGRVTRDDLAAAAAATLGAQGAASLGGAEALADMVALFAAGPGEGVSLGEFAAGMKAVARPDRASVGGGRSEL